MNKFRQSRNRIMEVHRVFWWYYPENGPFQAQATAYIYESGAYGPFESPSDAWVDWCINVSPDSLWACPWSRELVTPGTKARIAAQVRESLTHEVAMTYYRRHKAKQWQHNLIVIGLSLLVIALLVAATFMGPTKPKPFDGRNGQYCLIQDGVVTTQCTTLVPR